MIRNPVTSGTEWLEAGMSPDALWQNVSTLDALQKTLSYNFHLTDLELANW